MLSAFALALLADPPNEAATISPVVVELFTSEGCSSCPPADAVAAKLVALDRDDLLVLAYHVDYWDDLGWPDRFGSPEWTARQRGYNRTLGTGRVYTPQIILGGADETVGSNRRGIMQTLSEQLRADRPDALVVAAEVDGDVVTATLPPAPGEGSRLQTVLVQRTGRSAVKRGENAGRTLEHVNIVRALRSQPIEDGRIAETTVRLPLPDDATGEAFFVAAFAQRSDGQVTAAGVVDVER